MRAGGDLEDVAGEIAPPPSAAAAQCATVPPGKWPPSRTRVTPGSTGRLSPSQSRIAGSGRTIQLRSAACRCTGASKAAAQSCTVV